MTKQIAKMLTDDGYVVVDTVHDGEEALRVYKEKYPDIDLVSLDVTMPKMDGITALEQILAFDKDAHVIVATAYGNTNLVKRAIMLGAKNFIVKPLKEEEILPKYRAAMRK